MPYDRRPDPKIRREPRAFGPVHPGRVLREEFMEPLGLSPNALARALGVSPRRINLIVSESRAVTADTALRLARFFDMSAEFWMGLPSDYELETAREKLAEPLHREVAKKSEMPV